MDSDESILNTLEGIQSLRHFLKSEMSIGDPENGEIIATINVHNNAPPSRDKGDVVFLGVGLRITVGREGGNQRGSNYWPPKIKKSRPSDKTELRQTYDEGTWFGSSGASFPATTADEQSHGEVLFPGESVVYEIKISESELPYLDVRVEGSVSRRHLFHISQPMEALKPWTQPVIAETFRALDAIDFYTPLVSLSEVMPTWGPRTTIAEMDAFRDAITKAKDHVGKVMQELNNVYHLSLIHI